MEIIPFPASVENHYVFKKAKDEGILDCETDQKIQKSAYGSLFKGQIFQVIPIYIWCETGVRAKATLQSYST